MRKIQATTDKITPLHELVQENSGIQASIEGADTSDAVGEAESEMQGHLKITEKKYSIEIDDVVEQCKYTLYFPNGIT